MPLFYQQDINDNARLAIWKIEEAEHFFDLKVPLTTQIKHPHKRLQHLAGRYLLKFLYPDFPNEEIQIADTRKPFLPDEQYHFSISHCNNYAAAIVSSTKRVGIDVETISERIHKIKKKFLHPEELAFVEQKAKSQTELLTLLWCAKEAMFKWYGEGEVDFSEMMRISSFEAGKAGVLEAEFSKHNKLVPLRLQYTIFHDVVSVHVIS